MEKLKIYDVGNVEIANAVNELIENHNKMSIRVNTLIGLVETDLEHEKGYAKELSESVIQLTKALKIVAKELYREVDVNMVVRENINGWIKCKIEEWLKDTTQILNIGNLELKE